MSLAFCFWRRLAPRGAQSPGSVCSQPLFFSLFLFSPVLREEYFRATPMCQFQLSISRPSTSCRSSPAKIPEQRCQSISLWVQFSRGSSETASSYGLSWPLVVFGSFGVGAGFCRRYFHSSRASASSPAGRFICAKSICALLGISSPLRYLFCSRILIGLFR